MLEMVIAFAMLMILTAACGAIPNADLLVNPAGTQYEGGTKITDSFINPREKRAASIFLTGIRAVALQKLLRGLKQIGRSDPKYVNLVKDGDYDDALKDFKSLNPKNVVARKTETGVTVVRGNIGNKHLKLRSPGYKFGSNAVLDIIDINSPNKDLGIPYAVSVVYKKQIAN